MGNYTETFGALPPKKDIREYKASCSKRASAVNIPDEFELSMCAVKNQGSVGSCVAHSVAEMIEYFNKVQEGTNVVFSTGYIYGNRKNCSYTGSGMYVDKALGVVQKWGDVSNSLFNYNIEVPDAITKFEEKAFDLAPEAYEHRITEYFSLTTDEARKLNLMQNGPIVFSIPWYKGYKVDSDGVLRHTSEEVSGHHAMVIYGWNKKGWKFQNSWGTGFGTRGRAILPYDIKFGTCYGIKDENSKKAIADKIAELQKKIADLETTLSNKAVVIKDYEAKISKLTLQLNSLTVNKERLEQQVEELKKDANAKADEIQNLEAIIKDLKENNMTELVEKIKVLQQEKKAALNEIDKLKENVEELTKKNTELELMNEELLEIHKPFKNIPTWLAHVINAIINVFVKKK